MLIYVLFNRDNSRLVNTTSMEIISIPLIITKRGKPTERKNRKQTENNLYLYLLTD